jgi:hypothetical protein
MSTYTFARLWQTRGFAPDQFLFLTYAFNFRDFHDNVLRRLLENSEKPFIDVIASCVDLDEESNCFDYRYLSPLGKRFRLFCCDAAPTAHAKAVIARDSRTGKTLSGLGSANLTPSGWRRNVELWRWDSGRTASGILNMCQVLESRRELPSGSTARWRKAFSIGGTGRSPILLGTTQAPSFERVVAQLLKKIPRPQVVRVASPYFDSRSELLFKQLARTTSQCRLEIWTDRSGRLSEPTHWRVLANLLPTLRKRFKNVSVLAPKENAWHAKVLELDNGHGAIVRIVGSANFTGAAWGLNGSNLELVDVEIARDALPTLVKAREIEISPIGRQELIRLANREEKDQIADVKGPVLLWASLRETPPAVQIEARLARPERVEDWRIEASFDETRPENERRKLAKLQSLVGDARRWRLQQHGKRLLLAWLDGEDFVACERMTLKITTASGSTSAPVWITDPDWARRDTKTGIPLAPTEWTVDALLRGPKPIVSLRRPNRDPDQDEEVIEELNGPTEHDLRISHPDYDHTPELMRLADALQDPAQAEITRRRLVTIARKGAAKDRLLAHAAIAFQRVAR